MCLFLTYRAEGKTNEQTNKKPVAYSSVRFKSCRILHKLQSLRIPEGVNLKLKSAVSQHKSTMRCMFIRTENAVIFTTASQNSSQIMQYLLHFLRAQ